MRPPNPELINELAQMTEQIMGPNLRLYPILQDFYLDARLKPLLQKAKAMSDLGFHKEFLQMVADVLPYLAGQAMELMQLPEISKVIFKVSPEAAKTLEKNKSIILGYPALFRLLSDQVNQLAALPEVAGEVQQVLAERERRTQEIYDKDEELSPEDRAYLSEQTMLMSSNEIDSPISKEEWESLSKPVLDSIRGRANTRPRTS
jgi:hypothetical protein